jgi:hypothetical protein
MLMFSPGTPTGWIADRGSVCESASDFLITVAIMWLLRVVAPLDDGG